MSFSWNTSARGEKSPAKDPNIFQVGSERGNFAISLHYYFMSKNILQAALNYSEMYYPGLSSGLLYHPTAYQMNILLSLATKISESAWVSPSHFLTVIHSFLWDTSEPVLLLRLLTSWWDWFTYLPPQPQTATSRKNDLFICQWFFACGKLIAETQATWLLLNIIIKCLLYLEHFTRSFGKVWNKWKTVSALKMKMVFKLQAYLRKGTKIILGIN